MWGGWGMGWMMWFWILILFGCGWYFFWWLPRPYRYRRYRRSREDPLEIARRRLAEGEITPEEYEEIRKNIES